MAVHYVVLEDDDSRVGRHRSFPHGQVLPAHPQDGVQNASSDRFGTSVCARVIGRRSGRRR